MEQPEALAITTSVLRVEGGLSGHRMTLWQWQCQLKAAQLMVGLMPSSFCEIISSWCLPTPRVRRECQEDAGRQAELTESCSEHAPDFECGLACGLACGFGLAAAASRSRRLPTAAPRRKPGWLPAALITACEAAGTESYAARVVCRTCRHGRTCLTVDARTACATLCGARSVQGMRCTVHAVRCAVRRHLMRRCYWSCVSAIRPVRAQQAWSRCQRDPRGAPRRSRDTR